MALAKNDLKEIKKVVEDVVEEKTDKLAVMTKKGFDGQDKKINHLTKEVRGIRKEFAIHDFKMSEMVHKADYYKLEERIFKIERKVGLKK